MVEDIMRKAERLADCRPYISYSCLTDVASPRVQSLHTYAIALYLDTIPGRELYVPSDWSGDAETRKFRKALLRIGKRRGKDYVVTPPITPHSLSTISLKKILVEIAEHSGISDPGSYSIRELQNILTEKRYIQPNSDLTMNPGFDQVEDRHRALGTNVKDFVRFINKKFGNEIEKVIIVEDWGNSYAAPSCGVELLNEAVLREGLKIGKVYIFPLRDRRGHVGNPTLYRDKSSLKPYDSYEKFIKPKLPSLYKKLENGAILEKIADDVPEFSISEGEARIYESDRVFDRFVEIYGNQKGVEGRIMKDAFAEERRVNGRSAPRLLEKLWRMWRSEGIRKRALDAYKTRRKLRQYVEKGLASLL
ncbi:MAG: hypothetical protein HYX24_01425 [Candidatus Aenigmarchaeota archaeon]|nr:hypothetical protein [Candidatus Aenigmarchaeota archaeon]